MATSIIAALGYGSGLDSTALVTQLAAAARAPKESAIKVREASNAASVSALASVSGGIDAFASSLRTLIAGGTLMTQPTVSDTTLVGVKALTGSRLGDLSAQLEIRQLAQSQSLTSATIPARTSTVGKGVLTLDVGGTATAITIDATNNTLAGLAAAINEKKAGVTASIVADGGGFRLALKGQTGAAAAFTLSAAPAPADMDANGDPVVPAATLDAFAYDPQASGGMTRAQAAQDALVVLDGVALSRSQNSVADLIPGVLVDLKKAAVGTTVAIGSERPTEAITQALSDFASAYNEMKSLVDAATKPADSTGKNGGPLRGDYGMRDMARRLARLTSTPLTSGGGAPRTLAELGVATAKDGTLSVKASALAATIAADPDAVEAMFNPTQTSSSPFVTITSAMGSTAPGVYTLTDVVPRTGDTPPSGSIDGAPMAGLENSLSAPSAGAGKGLIVQASAAVGRVTIAVDLGLGGALQAIRDALRGTGGPLASTSSRLTKESTLIAADRVAIDARDKSYTDRLTAQFTAMEKRVSASKATQSYLEQQVALWTKSN